MLKSKSPQKLSFADRLLAQDKYKYLVKQENPAALQSSPPRASVKPMLRPQSTKQIQISASKTTMRSSLVSQPKPRAPSAKPKDLKPLVKQKTIVNVQKVKKEEVTNLIEAEILDKNAHNSIEKIDELEVQPEKTNKFQNPQKLPYALGKIRISSRSGSPLSDKNSLNLTHGYLANAAQTQKFAAQEQQEFIQTINQMEKEDVPAQDIEDYKKALILMKSIEVIKNHAEKQRKRRESPHKYDQIQSKFYGSSTNLNQSQSTQKNLALSVVPKKGKQFSEFGLEKPQEISNFEVIKEVKERPQSPKVQMKPGEHLFSKSFSSFEPHSFVGTHTPRDAPKVLLKLDQEVPNYLVDAQTPQFQEPVESEGEKPMLTKDQKIKLAARDQQIVDQQNEIANIMVSIQLQKLQRQVANDELRRANEEAARELEISMNQSPATKVLSKKKGKKSVGKFSKLIKGSQNGIDKKSYLQKVSAEADKSVKPSQSTKKISNQPSQMSQVTVKTLSVTEERQKINQAQSMVKLSIASEIILTSNLKSKSKPNQPKTLRQSSSIAPYNQSVLSPESTTLRIKIDQSKLTQNQTKSIHEPFFSPRSQNKSQSYSDRSHFNQRDDIPSQVPDILSEDLENFPKVEQSPQKIKKQDQISMKIGYIKKIEDLDPTQSEKNLGKSQSTTSKIDSSRKEITNASRIKRIERSATSKSQAKSQVQVTNVLSIEPEQDQDITPQTHQAEAATAESDEESTQPRYLKYMNPKVHEKTNLIQQKFEKLFAELEDQRSKCDRDIFYSEMERLNYDGVERYFASPTKRFVQHIDNQLEHKFKFKEEFQSPSKKGQQYCPYEKSYIVEPVGAGLNYKLIQTKPLEFYEQVLNQDVIKKKVFVDPAAQLNQSYMSQMTDRIEAQNNVQLSNYHGNHLAVAASHLNDVSMYTGRKEKLPLSYTEKRSKRHVGHIMDRVKVTIQEANRQKSRSPMRIVQVPTLSVNK